MKNPNVFDAFVVFDQMRRAFTGINGPRPAQSDMPQLERIRDNPGNLRAHYYVPNHLPPGAPLVVVLHGCRQTASSYDRGTRWSRLADRHGFALLFPEQQASNNNYRCFNWFTSGDSQRGMGEPASIRSMIAAMRERFETDPERTYITGLSAGGAMAAVMLATYPEQFAAGAIIAGVPYGCATDARAAFECMAGRAEAQAAELAARVLRASPHRGPWPRISVWQGDADETVAPMNADGLVLQWTNLHELAAHPTKIDDVEGYSHLTWLDSSGRIAVERYDITDMAHGVPLMPERDDEEAEHVACNADVHMISANIDSTRRIADFFGLLPAPAGKIQSKPRRRSPRTARAAHRPRSRQGAPKASPNITPIAPPMSDAVPILRKALHDALRAAGLMK